MSTTSTAHQIDFCTELAERLSAELKDPEKVRRQVDKFLPRNSFLESCFTKALVLPIVDEFTTAFLASRFDASREEVRRSLRCEGFATPMYASPCWLLVS